MPSAMIPNDSVDATRYYQNESADDFAGSSDASSTIAIMNIQNYMSRYLEYIIAGNFAQFKCLFEDRKLFVLNEPTLDCDPMTDHLFPKSIWPIYERDIAELQKRLYQSVWQLTKRILLLFVRGNYQPGVSPDVLYLLVQKIYLADLNIEGLKNQNDHLMDETSDRYKVDFKTINALKAQIRQAEYFGFVFKPDAVEKPCYGQQSIYQLQSYNDDLVRIIYTKDDVIAQFENRLEIMFAELEKLQTEICQLRMAQDAYDNLLSSKKQPVIADSTALQPESFASNSNGQHDRYPQVDTVEIQDYDAQPAVSLATLTTVDEPIGVTNLNLTFSCYQAADLNVYVAKNSFISLNDPQRFRSVIKAGDRHYIDLYTGIDYFKGPRGVYGYTDVNGDFNYMTKDGITVRLVGSGGQMYIIDEFGRQVEPTTYSDRYERVYVRRNGSRYQIDYFNYKYRMNGDYRIDLDDNFNPVKLPFFRQWGYKLQLIAKQKYPEFVGYFVDVYGKTVVEERLQYISEDGVTRYSNGDGITYFKDAKGFYFIQNADKCRRDKNGETYILRYNFAFKERDKSIQLGGKQYFYNDAFGYFYMLSYNDEQFVYDRAIKCMIIDEMHFYVVNELTTQLKAYQLVAEQLRYHAKLNAGILNDANTLEELQRIKRRAGYEGIYEEENFTASGGESSSGESSCSTEFFNDQHKQRVKRSKTRATAALNYADSSEDGEGDFSQESGEPVEESKIPKKRGNRVYKKRLRAYAYQSVYPNSQSSYINVANQASACLKYYLSPCYKNTAFEGYIQNTILNSVCGKTKQFHKGKAQVYPEDSLTQPLSNSIISQSKESYKLSLKRSTDLTESHTEERSLYSQLKTAGVKQTRAYSKRDYAGSAEDNYVYTANDAYSLEFDASPPEKCTKNKAAFHYAKDQYSKIPSYKQDVSASDESEEYSSLLDTRSNDDRAEDQPATNMRKRNSNLKRHQQQKTQEIQQQEPFGEEPEHLEKCQNSPSNEFKAQNFVYNETRHHEKQLRHSEPDVYQESPLANENAAQQMSRNSFANEQLESYFYYMPQREKQERLYAFNTRNTPKTNSLDEHSLTIQYSATPYLLTKSNSQQDRDDAAGSKSSLIHQTYGAGLTDFGCQAGVSFFYKEKHQAVIARSKVMDEIYRVSYLMRSYIVAVTPLYKKKDCPHTILTLDPFSDM